MRHVLWLARFSTRPWFDTNRSNAAAARWVANQSRRTGGARWSVVDWPRAMAAGRRWAQDQPDGLHWMCRWRPGERLVAAKSNVGCVDNVNRALVLFWANALLAGDQVRPSDSRQ